MQGTVPRNDRVCRVWVRLLRIVYTVAVVAASIATAASNAKAQIFTALYEFQGGTDGYSPNGLVKDSEGNLYGTTIGGGDTIFGTVFKLDSLGNKTTLYNFLGGTDGLEPHGNLLLDGKGNLYGTTAFGGRSDVSCAGYQGCGVVFKVDQRGNETVLYNFTGGADGGVPMAGLTSDNQGNLYGTTSAGGNVACAYGAAVGCGVVFKLDRTGNEITLYSFSGGRDSGNSQSPLIRDSSGNLYGMTSGVGAGSDGTVFRIDTHDREAILYAFSGGTDGSQPYGGLVRDTKGNLYGTTYGGGIYDLTHCGYGGCGVIFKVLPFAVSATVREKVVYSFTGGAGGWGPVAGLSPDKSGNLYGTTALGGVSDGCCGVVYQLSPDGIETVLHTFTGGADGGSPETSVIQDANGNLFGTALLGSYGGGVIFKLTP
jgi:uncharacterized repeat protein (TIGR03803 family)